MKKSIINYIACTGLLLPAVPLWATDRPNILIIQTDEQSFRTLGCYRQLLPEAQQYPWGKGNQMETPHIDYLAGRGILF
ncbi:MAG: hypothetical protein LUD02_05015 [Tannerellaceae bacterium]|nr:hypothetical protein [Tannerellaceae bacterium]MCD8263586.1 hypothetical protein [Tannerellaceae bacterium]